MNYVQKTFRLHPAQQNVFIDQLININSPQYNIGGYIILKGTLDTKILGEVVNEAPGVFDAFKMRFDANASELLGYLVEDDAGFQLSRRDFSNESHAADSALQWMRSKMNEPFILRKTHCLFEQVLLTIGADEHWLFGRFHHLIMDGYGFTIWMNYMADKYRSLTKSEPGSFYFPSYIEETGIANGSVAQARIADDDLYWKQRVPRKPKKLFHSKNNVTPNEALTTTYTHNFSAGEREKLDNLAQSLKAGIHQITIAALLIYFGKTSDAGNIVFGLPVHKRNSRKLRKTIGLFNGFIPYSGVYEPTQTIAGLVRSIVTAQAIDYRHQQFDISSLARHLQLNPAEENLWEILVNYLPFNLHPDFGEELQASIYPIANEYGRIPLQVCWNDYGLQQKLELQIHFSKQYFDKVDIRLLSTRLLHLLMQLGEDVNKPVKEITILPPEELGTLDQFSKTVVLENIYDQPIPFSRYIVQVRTADEQLAGIGVNGTLSLVEQLDDNASLSQLSQQINTGITLRWTPEGELVKAEEDGDVPGDAAQPAVKVPVSITASFVAEMLEEYLEYWSNEFELNLDVHISPYNQVFQQLLSAESLFNTGEGINVLLIRVEDWIRDQLTSTPSGQVKLVHSTCEQFLSAIVQARKLSAKPCLVGIVPWIMNPALDPQVQQAIKEAEETIKSRLREISLFYEVDLQKAIELYEVQEVFDATADAVGHIPFTDECFAAIGTYLVRKIRAWKSPAYKVIALDCDNTLWKGICGEVGPLNVIISAEYQYLQTFLIQKYAEGFLLVLCSKNNEDDVWEVFDHHPEMKLKREHIAAHKIDWQPKPSNLQSLAATLNLGSDSFIFLDDSAFEIEQMEMASPGVMSVVLPPEEAAIPAFLNHLWVFDTFYVTDEDKQRNSRYRAENQRKLEQAGFDTLADFLVTLGVDVKITNLGEKELERAVQLSLRTNQFNLNGVRKSSDDILRSMADPGCLNWIIEVNDRFGDYGMTGLVLAEKIDEELVLDTFLLSCRVLGRNVEDNILETLKQHCKENGLTILRARFLASEKNKPFIEFLIRTNWIADPRNNSYYLPISY